MEINQELYGYWSKIEQNIRLVMEKKWPSGMTSGVRCRQETLKQAFPELHSLSQAQEASVADLWTGQGWNLHLRRNLNDWEITSIARFHDTMARATNLTEEQEKRRRDGGLSPHAFGGQFGMKLFLEQLDSVLQGSEDSISHDELLCRSRDPSISDYGMSDWRPLFVTSGEIRKRSEFFEPFILGLTNTSVEQFCKSAVEPMSEESDHVQIIALSDALGVPIRVVYLDRSSCENNSINVNHHDFIPTSREVGNSDVSKTTNPPSITLLYRPGHYDILYPK
ncbi:hypothetical protein H5410_020852 [Solanum commersonii]|uniref:ubiquitinyl hydrolase 1 n=1 Tax=Solanum commersonii TaxID=4109 RepID=A0A9J5Z986_SOLCO|nr:hypothetical protein H5410_020852 [Solanum commersonii]